MTTPATGHALVTGGSSGIGLAVAEQLARSGAAITLVARDPARLEAARRRVEQAAGRPSLQADTAQEARAPVFATPADVTDEAALQRAVAEAEASFGPVTRLIASAGISGPGRFEEIPTDAFRRQLDINVIGTVSAVRAVLPAMRRAGRGRIALLSSGAGLIGVFGYTAYSATKFAVRGFGEALAAELDGSGITVSICYPPDTETPMREAELASGTAPAETRAITGSGGLMSAERVARALIAGMDAGRLHVTPGLEMTALQRFGGPVDPLIRRYLGALARRARARPAGRDD